jgi:hypothetical protein
MKSAYKYKETGNLDTGSELVIPYGETEIGVLPDTGPEDAANDNAPLLDVVKGAVWREVETLQAQSGAAEEQPVAAAREDLRELDFSAARTGPRGFLDEG